MRRSSPATKFPARLDLKSWKLSIVCTLILVATASATAGTSSNILARIALLADTHTGAGTNSRQALFKTHLLQAAAQVNAAKIDLVLIAGDLTDHGKVEEMDEFLKEIRQFAAPVWFVPGNHDVGNAPSAGRPPVVTSDRVALFEERLGPAVFSRALAGVRVIGLTSALFGSGLPREVEMWRFLQARLEETNGGPVLLLLHKPPFIKSAQEPASYYNIEPAARSRLLSLLHKARVPALLSGHYHRPRVNRLEGRLFITTPPISFSLPARSRNEGWTLITVGASGEIQYEFKLFRK